MKYQEEVVNDATLYAAVMFKLVEYIETTVAEYYDIDEVAIEERDLDPANIVGRSLVTVRLYNIPEDLTKEVEIGRTGVILRIEARGPAYGGISYRTLFTVFPRVLLRLDRYRLRNLAFRTAKDGIEYIILYADNGVGLILEGEYLRVSIPFIRTAASIHTHPEGSCGLSRHDIQSGLDLLVEGGLMEAAATPSCAFVMRREGAVSEDDYVNVKLMSGPVFKDTRLGSIVFERIYY
ncbi:MAG: hypothetical protein F7C08_03640 [Desulfurococcales archaeon]|nr:hypothetical protein [Desulfurococcales archaeon]MCE4605606.1 hypothetical protein [Desulfurococcales archaeon]